MTSDMLVSVMPEVDGEVSVYVSSSSVVDWPTVVATLSPDVRANLAGRPISYRPGRLEADRIGDWWVFGAPRAPRVLA